MWNHILSMIPQSNPDILDFLDSACGSNIRIVYNFVNLVCDPQPVCARILIFFWDLQLWSFLNQSIFSYSTRSFPYEFVSFVYVCVCVGNYKLLNMNAMLLNIPFSSLDSRVWAKWVRLGWVVLRSGCMILAGYFTRTCIFSTAKCSLNGRALFV